MINRAGGLKLVTADISRGNIFHGYSMALNIDLSIHVMENGELSGFMSGFFSSGSLFSHLSVNTL